MTDDEILNLVLTVGACIAAAFLGGFAAAVLVLCVMLRFGGR